MAAPDSPDSRSDLPSDAVTALVAVVDRLLADDGGCVWNRAQTHATLAPYAVEEAYELVDAIDAGDVVEMREELGDVLYQVVLHAGLAERAGEFTLADVADTVTEKMTRRHPHVFGDETADTVEDVVRVWRAAKAAEKAARTSVFDGVPRAMPPLERAGKVLERAEERGIDTAAAIGAVRADLQAVRGHQDAEPASGTVVVDAVLGADLLRIVQAARADGVDVVASLRAALDAFESTVRTGERAARDHGV